MTQPITLADGGRSRRSSLGSLRRVGRVAFAFARLASLLPCRTGTAVPAHARSGDDVVVLLHGLFATAGVLKPLGSCLEREAGAHIASFTYEPGPGVDEVASRVARLVSRLPEGVRIHLVGHSLGGLAARWYVQLMGGDPRVVQTISLGSPFGGTPRGRLMPGRAGEHLRPESHVLKRLADTARVSVCVPHVSIVASDDSLAGPDPCLPTGERLVIPGCGHNGLLYDRRVARAIVRRVRSAPATA